MVMEVQTSTRSPLRQIEPRTNRRILGARRCINFNDSSNGKSSCILIAQMLLNQSIISSTESFKQKWNFDPIEGKPLNPTNAQRFEWKNISEKSTINAKEEETITKNDTKSTTNVSTRISEEVSIDSSNTRSSPASKESISSSKLDQRGVKRPRQEIDDKQNRPNKQRLITEFGRISVNGLKSSSLNQEKNKKTTRPPCETKTSEI